MQMEVYEDDNNLFRKLLEQSKLVFDYEVNSVKIVEDENGIISSVVQVFDKTGGSKNFSKIYLIIRGN
jgi:hypothetical protein